MKRFFNPFIIFGLVLVSFSTTWSQEFNISLVLDYGSFRMNALKELQEQQSRELFDSLGVQPKAVASFPSYFGARMRGTYGRSKHLLNFTAGSNVTGGRLHYSDYSGLIKIDKVLFTAHLSGGYSYQLLKLEKIRIDAGVSLGLAFSSFTADNAVEIYVTEEFRTESFKFRSIQSFLSPEFAFYYFPYSRLFVNFLLGFHQQLSSSKWSDPTDWPQPSWQNDNVKPNWSGFRIGAGVGLKLEFQK